MHAKNWMDCKCIMLNEISQVQKTTYYMHPFIWNSRNDREQFSVFQGQNAGVWEWMQIVRGIFGVLEMFNITTVTTLVNLLKLIQIYIYTWWILFYVNYICMKLLK